MTGRTRLIDSVAQFDVPPSEKREGPAQQMRHCNDSSEERVRCDHRTTVDRALALVHRCHVGAPEGFPDPRASHKEQRAGDIQTEVPLPESVGRAACAPPYFFLEGAA
jgi:hypothetical protein